MHRFLLVAMITHCSLNICAQQIKYYDESFRTTSETKTPYYRTFQDLDSVIQVVEISNDTIVARGRINAGIHKVLANDIFHFVKNNGNPYQFKSEFEVMRCEVDFYDEGRFSRKMISHGGKILHAQVAAKNGDFLLTDGNGSNIYKENESTIYEHYADSILTEQYEVRSIQRDTLYYTYDKMAEPADGYQAFMQDLTKILKYPGFARLAGKEGIIYIQFVVDKNGKLGEFTPLTKEGFNLEKKAIKKLSEMPPWNPAVFRGKFVKMKFALPIRFRLI